MQAASNTMYEPRVVDETTADAAACKSALNAGSKSFHAASLLLPKEFASDATALYAFCRLTDDLIDNAVASQNCADHCEPGSGSRAVMQSLFERLDSLYLGEPYPHPADRALLPVVERHRLPKSLFLSLFEGFDWDASGRRYETIEDVYAYGARVAGTVGVMMSVLMGVRAPEMVARAADLGVAMQLSNIARDVGEDARAGRLYLPQAWLREVGIDPEAFLNQPKFSPALGQVIARLLSVADQLYARADSGIAKLPRRFRPGMYAARLLYAEIGNEIRRQACNSVEQRAVVSSASKVRILTGLTKLPFLGTQKLSLRALDETEYLVELLAVEDAQYKARRSPTRQASSPLTGLSAAGEWVLDLFDELDRRDARGAALNRKSGTSAV